MGIGDLYGNLRLQEVYASLGFTSASTIVNQKKNLLGSYSLKVTNDIGLYTMGNLYRKLCISLLTGQFHPGDVTVADLPVLDPPVPKIPNRAAFRA